MGPVRSHGPWFGASSRFVRALPPAIAGAAVLSACAATPLTPPTSPTAAPKPATAPAAPTAAPAAASPTAAAQAGERAADQTLCYIGAYVPSGLLPVRAGGGDPDFMLQMTYMPAFYLDRAGRRVNGVATGLAVITDGLKYTLKLEPRAKFSDESKVTERGGAGGHTVPAPGIFQYALRSRKTTNRVRKTILMSSQKVQFSTYHRS